MEHLDQTQEPAGVGPITVAIVDDDPVARAAIGAMVQRESLVQLVGDADSVAEIVEVVRRERPEVAIVDWKMPDGGGPEAARQILMESPGTRLVGITSSTSPVASMDMLRAGATSLFLKGGSSADLVDAVQNTLKH